MPYLKFLMISLIIDLLILELAAFQLSDWKYVDDIKSLGYSYGDEFEFIAHGIKQGLTGTLPSKKMSELCQQHYEQLLADQEAQKRYAIECK